MHPNGSCKCRHCGKFFQPDVRNRARQRHCFQPVCRRKSKAASQRAWLSRPENADYFRDEDNATRAREWQAANPGYWKKRRKRLAKVLQEASKAQPPAVQTVAVQDERIVLQDLLTAQSPVLVGLIAHLTGTVLQDDIAAMTRTLHSRGQAILGIDAERPDYAKTPHQSATGTAHAVPV